MNTEKTPTIYGTVTFEQFNDAIKTVCKYLDGLTNAYAIKDILTEEHRNKLEPDLLMACLSMLRVNMTQDKFIAVVKDLQAKHLEEKAAKERAAHEPSEPAQAEPSEPAQAEPGNTYEPTEENL